MRFLALLLPLLILLAGCTQQQPQPSTGTPTATTSSPTGSSGCAPSSPVAHHGNGTVTLLTPVDHGHVELNYDTAWFADHNLSLPKDLADVANSTYAPLTVVENPETASPGMAFLLATIDRFGDPGFASFWSNFTKNGGKV